MTSLVIQDWRTLVRRIKEKRVTPFISDRVSSQFLPGNENFVQAWAEDMNYPLGSSFSVVRLAQFLRVITREDLAAKEEFLAFSKRHLLRSTPAQELDEQQAEQLRLTDLTIRLNTFGIEERAIAPLHLLAKLPLPIYITTSYYNFLELALKDVGKQPRTEICYWRDELKEPVQIYTTLNPLTGIREVLVTRFSGQELRTLCYDLALDYENLPGESKIDKARELIEHLKRHDRLSDLIQLGKQRRSDILWDQVLGNSADLADETSIYQRRPSVFEQEPDYRPSVQEPLIYHLHGLDLYPASMVLTEDDYLDFLVKISGDRKVIPNEIGKVFTHNSLLLLGYRLQDWDFRVLFRGLIARKQVTHSRFNLSIQLSPDQEAPEQITSVEEAQDYLEMYFHLAKFKIYWGDSQSFMQELWAQWEK